MDNSVALQQNEATKKCSKENYDCHIYPHSSLVKLNWSLFMMKPIILLVMGNLSPCGRETYIAKHCLVKGAFFLYNPNFELLKNTRNGIYLNTFYP